MRSSSNPATPLSAWATDTSSAAEELRPEPIGTSDAMARSAPLSFRPLAVSSSATPTT